MTAYEQKKAQREATQAAANSATAGAAAAAPPPAEAKVYDVYMKLSGIASTDVFVAQYLSRLSQSTLFRDVNLVITDEFKIEESKYRRFQIELMLNPEIDARKHAEAASQKTAAVEVKE
jgi:hypothetical protein